MKSAYSETARVLTIIALTFFAAACSRLGSTSNQEFRETQSGAGLYSCVAGGGDLKVKKFEAPNVNNGFEAVLEKSGKVVTLQFDVNNEINQAKLVGASMSDKEKVSKLDLMISLELICGGEVASKVLPDEYNALQMLNGLRGLGR